MEAGYAALDTRAIMKKTVRITDGTLRVNEQAFDLARFKRLIVIGIGKCAFDAADALEEILGDRITKGVILDVKGGILKHLKSYEGTHPFPSEENMMATAAIMALVKNASEEDLVLAVISGGGSALLCWPHDVRCETLMRITDELFRAGATIQELNTVRKHLSEIQGGQLAKLAYPATVVSIIFSDVPGNDISMVASGPTVMDPTTQEDAARIMAKYDVLKKCELPDCEIIETPKDPKYFVRVTNMLIGSNLVALQRMKEKAEELGFHAVICETCLMGEARDVGRPFIAGLERGMVFLSGGETTVTVRGRGKGGRNQEVALGALPYLKEGMVFASFASDGIDNTDAAGAIADGASTARANEAGIEREHYLAANDAYHFFEKLDDLIVTGITGANVSDLMVAVRE